MDWPDSRGRAGWWLAAVLVAVVVVWVLFSYVGTFILGLFLYYVTRPAYRRLRRYVRPNVAAATSLLALAVPVLLLVAYTLAVAAQELDQLRRTVELGPLADRLEPYADISTVVQDPQTLLQNPDVLSAGQSLAEGALGYVPLVGSGVIHLFLALALAFYLLRDGPKLGQWLRSVFADQAGLVDTYAEAVDTDLASVYFGNILNAIFIAVVAVVAYTVLNVFAPADGIPYPALVALLAGAASLIPVVGMKIVYVPMSVGLFARSFVGGEPLWFPAAFVVVTVVFVDVVPDLVLRPYVSGRNLHVGLVMIAYILGPLLFGWYGLFLGPFLLVVVYHFMRLVVPVLVDRGAVTPAEPATEPPNPDQTDESADGADPS
jgi:predicted PurR-regulated permease PerM